MTMMPGPMNFGALSMGGGTSPATQPGGFANPGFDMSGGLGPLNAEQLNTVWNLINGKPVDADTVARLVDDSGVLGDVSTQQGVSAFENFSAGNIGGGIQNAANAFGVEIPSIGGFNPLSLIG
ncbi:MAG: hypothetical protein JJU21_17320 [Salinarimonas sp.]|nr:hypothetical protein [Salinarimonas sp.]